MSAVLCVLAVRAYGLDSPLGMDGSPAGGSTLVGGAGAYTQHWYMVHDIYVRLTDSTSRGIYVGDT